MHAGIMRHKETLVEVVVTYGQEKYESKEQTSMQMTSQEQGPTDRAFYVTRLITHHQRLSETKMEPYGSGEDYFVTKESEKKIDDGGLSVGGGNFL